MKRLNLETINQQATFTTHLINKARLDLGVTYNAVSMGMAHNVPLPLIFQKIRNDYPEIYTNIAGLQSVFDGMAMGFPEGVFKPEMEILENIRQSLDAMNDGVVAEERLLASITKILMLLGLVFADLQKLADEFENKCKLLNIHMRPMMEWNEDDPIALSIEEEIPIN
mgnify:CR=1 FL=1